MHLSRCSSPTSVTAGHTRKAGLSRDGLKTAPYDLRMDKIHKAAGQSARRLTDLLTRPVGTGQTT
jgi:hypothetical protein